MLDTPSFRRAHRISNLEISEIVQISERAAARKVQGYDIVSLSTGEPDFPTPDHVIEAAHGAALAGQTRYTATLGTAALRAAIADDAGARPDEVIVSTGAKQVIANAMLATLDAGDQVVMPAPYWTSYSDIVTMAGGTPVIVPCAMTEGFKLTPAALESALTPRTRWLMLNAPSNPSGAIYSREEILALAEVLARHPHVWVLSDEIYEHLNFVPFCRFVAVAPELRDRLLTVNGVSKAWSMTGWRIGWGVGPVALIKAMGAVQGQITSGACSIAQAAAVAALTGDRTLLDTRREVLRARRDLVVSALNAMPGVDCASPDGAFYAFPRITGAMAAQGHATDADFCDWLLDHHNLALVPGRAFGLPGHLRLSFAYAETDLKTGLARMASALNGGN
ncbi:pyridoxal phosphate-dependent aminotransferase [Pseudotabrizicola alkalilacus]|uniref:Aminotransferase n=1 Tax=Pseudotabrizicola alkalilacus TaxID=2305252 RepID=A0A411YWK8_9RHOB|nr:pyridoxal phosphate-dependent aminotransferase [Pseudotabrizicola alkalilacus]RGP35271.1 pyridoxal phosphate-dependent aminotransferase [Pseudotabrizicola alkalilacus]